MADRFDPEQFQAWVESPRTKLFLSYLWERREMLADQWARGQEMGPKAQLAALLLGEISSLKWADVDRGYQEIDEWREQVRQWDAETQDNQSGA